MHVFVRCEKDDHERLFSYDSAMLVSVLCCGVLCCGRYACANARAQMKACTKEWLRVPVGFFSDRQLQYGMIPCRDVIIRGLKANGWGAAHMFREPWITSTGMKHPVQMRDHILTYLTDNTCNIPHHKTCNLALLLTCPALSDGPVPLRNMGGGDSGGRSYVKSLPPSQGACSVAALSHYFF